MFVTASHQFPKRPQDAMAIWVEDVHKDNFKVCLRETKILDGTHKSIKIVSKLKVWFCVSAKEGSIRTLHEKERK